MSLEVVGMSQGSEEIRDASNECLKYLSRANNAQGHSQL